MTARERPPADGAEGQKPNRVGEGRQPECTPPVSSTAATPYQLLPELADDEYVSLKADIAQRGVQVPVEYDELGNILDGHHRVRACEELGIKDWPSLVRGGMSEDEKRRHVRRLNLARRHLSRKAKRQLIGDELVADPDRSDRELGRLLGVDHKTVGSVRRELRGEVPHAPDDDEDYSETEIAELMAGVLEGRSEDYNPRARAIAVQVADVVRDWANSELPNMFFFVEVARTLYMNMVPLDLWNIVAIWLVPVAQQSLLEAEGSRFETDTMPGAKLARVTIALWSGEADDDTRLAMIRGMETKILVAVVDAEKISLLHKPFQVARADAGGAA